MRKTFENKKITLGLLTVALVFAIVVVSSFWPFILDPNHLDKEQFLTDELIITAIVLSVTVSMMFVAEASNAQNPASEIARAKVDFKASLDRIDSHTSFFDWVKNVLQRDDMEEIVRREMAQLLIPAEVFRFGEREIASLAVKTEVNGKEYGPYEHWKLKKVIALKKRMARMKVVSPNYYVSAKSIEISKTYSEQAVGENFKKVMTIVAHLFTRILITWMAASILGSLVRDITQEGGSSAQAWMRFLSRAFAFGSSCFLGYNLGCRMNDLDAFYIAKRVEVHKLYLEGRRNGEE